MLRSLTLPVPYRCSTLSSIINQFSPALSPCAFDQLGVFVAERAHADQNAAFSDLLLEFMRLFFRNARSVKRAERPADQPPRECQWSYHCQPHSRNDHRRADCRDDAQRSPKPASNGGAGLESDNRILLRRLWLGRLRVMVFLSRLLGH